MKKHTEKLPIDELFARKLGNASLRPGSDSFARLQARMGQHKPEPRLGFWRNPDVQRAIAAAACLLLVCLIGWRYWPSSGTTGQKGAQVATNQPATSALEKQNKEVSRQPQREQPTGTERKGESIPQININQVAVADKADRVGSGKNGKTSRVVGQQVPNQSYPSLPVAPALAQEKSVNSKPKVDVASPVFVAPIAPVSTEQVAVKPIAQPNPVTERVLVVTIAEPEALVAARQAAKAAVNEKVALAQQEKAAKEVKTDGLWQKVKRIKEGEVFARQDNASNDEGGLLGRAYSGLKHSLEKDKPLKQ